MKKLKTYKQLFEQRKISSNADINECIDNNDLEKLEKMLKNDKNILKNINFEFDSANPLFFAIREGKIDFVKLLVENNYYLGPQGKNAYSGIIYSLTHRYKIFKYIVENSKNYVNTEDIYGYTPLMAVFEDTKNVYSIGENLMKVLFKNGADPFFKTKLRNMTLFDLIEKSDHDADVKSLEIFFKKFPEYKEQYNKYKKTKEFNL